MIVLHHNTAITLLIGCLTLPVVALLHELGHAIPALLFSRQRVQVFIGSYGDVMHSWEMPLGRLSIWWWRNPLRWRFGLCRYERLPAKQRLVVLFGGPLMPAILGTIVYAANVYFQPGYLVADIMWIFTLITWFGLINLVPNPIGLQQTGGRVSTDGTQILRLLLYARREDLFQQALALFDDGKYPESADLFQQLVQPNTKDPFLLRYAMTAMVMAKRNEETLALFERLGVADELNTTDYCAAGLAHGDLQEIDAAMADFNKSLELDPENVYSLNNRGFYLNQLGRYREALADLDNALALDDKFSYALGNRGWAKIKLGQVEEGLQEIQRAIIADAENGYNYRYLGLYHLENGDPVAALEWFEKAKAQEPDMPDIDTLIAQAQRA